MSAECVGYTVDSSNYRTSLVIVASSNPDAAPKALVRPGDWNSAWKASAEDVDGDGDFVYSVILSPSQNQYIARIRMDVANVAVVMLYVQCRERPGRWSVASSPVCPIFSRLLLSSSQA